MRPGYTAGWTDETSGVPQNPCAAGAPARPSAAQLDKLARRAATGVARAVDAGRVELFQSEQYDAFAARDP